MTRATTATPRRSRRLAQLAGLVSAGVALGVGELVSGLGHQGQSLVGSVGGEVIDLSPGPLVRTGIDEFGTGDKTVLLTTIVVLCLVLGAAVGSAARRRPWIGPVSFSAAALLGVLAGLRDPLASKGVTVLAGIAAAVAGSVVLAYLLRYLPADPRAEEAAGPAATVPGRGTGDRRTFLTLAGTAGAAGVLAAVAGRALSERSRSGTSSQDIVLPEPTATLPGTPSSTIPPSQLAEAGLPIDDLTPLITPNGDFYRIDTALVVPRPGVDGWRLRINGEVDAPFDLTYDDLLALPQVEVPVTLSCVSNNVGGPLVGNAVWQGVSLPDLLERAQVRPTGEQIVGRSLDGFTAGFPTSAALDGRVAIVAVGMNGEPLPPNHGFPARLVVEGLYGYVSATKWLSSIELHGWDFEGYWVPLGWSQQGPIKTASRIDVPRSKDTLHAGPVPVAGVAWAPDRGISKVEVQVDDGPWEQAELGVALSDATWRQWVWTWEAEPGDHTLRVRATDGTGETQTSDSAPPEPDGATGWHSRKVNVKS